MKERECATKQNKHRLTDVSCVQKKRRQEWNWIMCELRRAIARSRHWAEDTHLLLGAFEGGPGGGRVVRNAGKLAVWPGRRG